MHCLQHLLVAARYSHFAGMNKVCSSDFAILPCHVGVTKCKKKVVSTATLPPKDVWLHLSGGGGESLIREPGPLARAD